jgi:hypothetical protein
VSIYNCSHLIQVELTRNRYHWALMVAPKTEKKDSRGTRFHARDKARPDGTSPFFYEEVDLEVNCNFISVNKFLWF